MSWDTEEEFLGEMLLSGAARGIVRDEEDGELMISWDFPMLRALYPAVFDAMVKIHEEEVAETVEQMVADGLLEREPIIHPDGELEEEFKLTDLGKQVLGEIDTTE